MFKKTLISLAVASTLGLTGCWDDGGQTNKNANPDYKISNPAIDGKTWPIFNPALSQLPIPNDLIIDQVARDGTFRVADTSPPVTTALNSLSGASTVAPAVVQFNGQIDPESVVANQTVFLIKMQYASGDPIQGLSNREPPQPVGLASIRADVETLSGQSAIRLLPLEPLDPRTRYLVVVTNGVKDINGDAIIKSPSYDNISDTNQALGNAALQPVRDLVTGLWEPTALGFLSVAAPSLGITSENIALTYSFTTSNDKKVLQYIAKPASWFSDQLSTFVKVSAAKAAVEGGASGFAAVNTVVQGALTAFPTPEIEVALSPIFDAAPPLGCQGLTGQNAFDCVGTALAGNFDAWLPTPTGRSEADITIDVDTIKPAALVTALVTPIFQALGASPDSVLTAQGTISLPYYLQSTPAGVVQSSWVADDGLATALNTAFESINLALPQANPAVTRAVNYIFPFPKKVDDKDVPFLTIYPSSGGIEGVVIYQHGITTDRSAALTFGTALASQGFAVVAIDHPLHGVAPVKSERQNTIANQLLASGQQAGLPETLAPSEQTVGALIAGALNLNFVTGALIQQGQDPEDAAAAAPGIIANVLGGGSSGNPSLDQGILFLAAAENTVANAGSTVPGIAPQIGNERHFNLFAAQPGTPGPMDFENGVGDSGSLFMNLTSFLTSRDNLRQSAVDKMNLRASLEGFTLPVNGTEIDASTPVYFVGHSLGTITGMPFIAALNANQTSGVNPGLAANDIAAASLLTPGGGIVRLLENSESFAPSILLGLQQAAGLAQGDANLETYFNVFQAALDTADPINIASNLHDSGIPVLLSEIEGDTVIPNAADEALWDFPALSGTLFANVNGTQIPVTINSFNAPLAGTQPLTIALGEDSLTSYSAGTHGTPVSADNVQVFGAMVCETLVTFGVALPDLPGVCLAP